MIADEPAKGSRILLGARRGSGGQEGGWVVRGDGLGAEGDEVGVVGGGEGVDWLGGGEGLLAECLGFAALCGVEDEDAVGEVGDAGVAAVGAVFENALFKRLRIGRSPRLVEFFDAGETVFHITIQSKANLIAGCLSPSLGHNSVSACAWSLPHYTL